MQNHSRFTSVWARPSGAFVGWVGYATLRFQVLIFATLIFAIPAAADFPQASSTDAIIRGLPAPSDAQPWMVALIRNTTRTDLAVSRLQFCGGTLINPEWVLTAAHCVLARSISDMSLIIGESNLDAGDNEFRRINQIVIHPKYDARNIENDVALLRLESPSHLTPLELFTNYSDTAVSGASATVFGWGRTYIDNEKCEPIFDTSAVDPDDFDCKIHDLDPGSRDFQKTLLQTELTLLSDVDCLARIEELLEFLNIPHDASEEGDSQFVSSQICAYDPAEFTGLCFGDSGGPLVLDVGGQNYQAGIASLIYGSGGCAREFATDVFTKTAVFLDFIDDVVNRDYALSFENLCPPQLEPMIEYTPLANGNSQVRIQWQAQPQSTQYTLRYSSYPLPTEHISSVNLGDSVTEVSAELEANTSFYVTVQASNGFCSGPDSDLLAVQVPAP